MVDSHQFGMAINLFVLFRVIRGSPLIHSLKRSTKQDEGKATSY
jgi:hypothetical protein